MSIAAVPSYLGTDFKEASPGQRFGMYLGIWNNQFAKETNAFSALSAAGELNDNDKAILKGLLTRQQAAFCTDANTLQLDAIATAPFTTGLGNAHPLENGFAFLNPYGLPYLPGSGVKGVLRQAARELASGEWSAQPGWNESAITALFGLESADGDTEHLRGALSFWDVIPQIKGDSLAVEIMTPHQKHYYQDGKTPHDSGQPTPISFLTVPPGSGFTFHVQCNFAYLQQIAPILAKNEQWKILLTTAFEHAFDWCGFGAKTAVGYGAMGEDKNKKIERQKTEKAKQDAEQKALQEAARQQEIATMNPVDKAIAECLDSRVDKTQPEINVLLAALKNNQWEDGLAKEIAKKLKEKMQSEKKWRESSEKKNPDKDKDYVNTQIVIKFLK